MAQAISDQLRQAIKASELTRYRISMETGIDQSVLSKFMARTTGLSQASIDAIGQLLGLRLVADHPPEAATRKEAEAGTTAKTGRTRRKNKSE